MTYVLDGSSYTDNGQIQSLPMAGISPVLSLGSDRSTPLSSVDSGDEERRGSAATSAHSIVHSEMAWQLSVACIRCR